MIRLINSYFEYLATHPDKVNSILLWTMTMAVVWFMQFRYRVKMIDGMSGDNKLFEAAEQVAWILNWVWPPIVCYSAFFNVELSNWIWYFTFGCIAYTLGGRWLFQWVLALRAGSTEVKTDQKTEP